MLAKDARVDAHAKPFVAVHVGAGYHSTHKEQAYKTAMKRACNAAECARDGAVEAVCRGIMSLEDDACTNAGQGSNLNMVGHVECDASIMEGTSAFGAIGAAAGIKNPIAAARALAVAAKLPLSCGRVRPLLLVGDGARNYAASEGLETVTTPEQLQQYHVTPAALRAWHKYKQMVSEADMNIPASLASASIVPDTTETEATTFTAYPFDNTSNPPGAALQPLPPAAAAGPAAGPAAPAAASAARVAKYSSSGQRVKRQRTDSRDQQQQQQQAAPLFQDQPGMLSSAQAEPGHAAAPHQQYGATCSAPLMSYQAPLQPMERLQYQQPLEQPRNQQPHHPNCLDSGTCPDAKVETEHLECDPMALGSSPEVADTVGCIAVDRMGCVAAGVSSGGIAFKFEGRVGEAALYGCGCWAQDSVDGRPGVAISVTGVGENIIRSHLAKECGQQLISCADDPIDQVLCKVLQSQIPEWQPPLDCGVLAARVTVAGQQVSVEAAAVHSSSSMGIAHAGGGMKPGSIMLRQPTYIPTIAASAASTASAATTAITIKHAPATSESNAQPCIAGVSALGVGISTWGMHCSWSIDSIVAGLGA